MASSCIPGSGIRLDMEMVKTAAAAGGATAGAVGGAHSSPMRSSGSSTLSEACNSSSSLSSVASLSLKRARTPRKRPNQTYNEAAALLASMYPSVFATSKTPETAPPRLLALATALADDPSCSDLLPPFPVLGDAAAGFLLREAPQPQPPTPPRGAVPVKSCSSPAAVSSVFKEFRDPALSPATPDAAAADELGELDFEDEDGFDADSFLGVDDDGAAEGIDGIMGKLTMENNSTSASEVNAILSSPSVHPYIRSLMVLGLGFRHGRQNINRALKRHDDASEWWMCPAIPVKDITAPRPPLAMPVAAAENKKSKKRVEKVSGSERECKYDEEGFSGFANGGAGVSAMKAPKTGLGLNLNTDEVLKAWCDRGSMFASSNAPVSTRSSANVLAKLSDIDLFLDNSTHGVIREGSKLKMRHKQKQCTPLLSNKTRYQARKVHSERPRIKGRFVSKASLLHQASEKEDG